MHFIGLLKSLDEFLYEVMSWLIFYPITLWRALRRPLEMMDYSDHELGQADAQQYTDTLRLPLFLLVSLLLAHAVELAVVGDSPLIASNRGLSALVTDDTSLLLMRLVIFGVFPLVFAARLVRLQRHGLTRVTLRRPFYAQCYAVAPLALTISLSSILMLLPQPGLKVVGLAACIVALLIFGAVQIRWFAQHLHSSLWAGFGYASVAMIESLAVIGLALPLLA